MQKLQTGTPVTVIEAVAVIVQPKLAVDGSVRLVGDLEGDQAVWRLAE